MDTFKPPEGVELKLLVHAAAAAVIYKLYSSVDYQGVEWRKVRGRPGLVSLQQWSCWKDDLVRVLVDKIGVSKTRALLARELADVPEFRNNPVVVTIGNQHGDCEVLIFTTPNITYSPAS